MLICSMSLPGSGGLEHFSIDCWWSSYR